MNVATIVRRCNVATPHGKGTKVYLDGIRGDNFLNSIETPVTVDTAETTIFNSSNVKTYIPGNADANLAAAGMWEGSSSESDEFLSGFVGSSSPKVLNWYPDSDALGNFGFGTQVYETGYNINSPVDGVVTVSVDGQADNGKFSVESLRALTTTNTTGSLSATTASGTADDNSAATTSNGIGWFQRVDTSTGAIVPKIQHSANNSTWDDLISFSSGTTRNGQRVAAGTTTIKRYTRAEWTITGSSTLSFNFHIGFTRL